MLSTNHFLFRGIFICLLFSGGLPSTLLAEHVEGSNASRDISLSCAVVFPDATVSDVNTIYIPFSLIGQLMVVQAQVDTQAGNFIVDTGAERLLLNERYFENTSFISSIRAIGNTGNVTAAKWRSVDSLHISQLSIPDMQAHLMDLTHIELKKNARIIGVMGYEVFKDFEMLIDFPGRLIVLNRTDRKGERIDTTQIREVPYDSVDFVLRRHLITFQANVNSVRIKVILDSGAELNLLDRRVHRKVLDKFTILKRINLVGVGKQEVEVLAGVLHDLQCEGQSCPEMNTLLTNLDQLNESFGTSVQGVLGYEFLKDRRTMINYKKEKLYFYNPIRP